MEIEGLIIQKTRVKEKDLLAHVLTGQGKKISLFFYGGWGGNKNRKATGLELGHSINAVLDRKKYGQISTVKEYKIKWIPHKSNCYAIQNQ